MADLDITTLLMDRFIGIIKETINGLPDDDPTRLRWLEAGPRSENFADELLSLEVRHNDPQNAGGWTDMEMQYWPSVNPTAANQRNPIQEIGGINQGFVRRFTVSLTLFYSELGMADEVAGPAAAIIMKRIHVALLRSSINGLRGLKDAYGEKVTPTNIVKKSELLGTGSSEEPNFRGRFWLEVVTEIDLP